MNLSNPDSETEQKPQTVDPSASLWAELQKRQHHKKSPVIIVITIAALIALGVLLTGLYIVIM